MSPQGPKASLHGTCGCEVTAWEAVAKERKRLRHSSGKHQLCRIPARVTRSSRSSMGEGTLRVVAASPSAPAGKHPFDGRKSLRGLEAGVDNGFT